LKNGDAGLMKKDFIVELKIVQEIFMLNYELDLTWREPLNNTSSYRINEKQVSFL